MAQTLKNHDTKYEVTAWPPDLANGGQQPPSGSRAAADSTITSGIAERYPQYVIFYVNVNTRSKYAKKKDGNGNIVKNKDTGRAEIDDKNFLDLTKLGKDGKETVKNEYINRASFGSGIGNVSLLKNATGLAESGVRNFGDLVGSTVEFISKESGESVKSATAKMATTLSEVDLSPTTYRRSIKAIVLPMPLQFRAGDAVMYDTTGVGGLAGMAMNWLNKDTASATTSTAEGGELFIKKILSGVVAGAANNLSGLVGGAGRAIDSARGSLEKVWGQTENTRKEQVFNDSAPRTFTFNYQLVPRNAQESIAIREIIKQFRQHMRPELSAASGQGAFYIMPNEFDIVMYTSNKKDGKTIYDINPFLPRIATSVLTNVEVDYTPNGFWAANKTDGSPSMIMLTLTFNEIEPLHRDMVEQGGY